MKYALATPFSLSKLYCWKEFIKPLIKSYHLIEKHFFAVDKEELSNAKKILTNKKHEIIAVEQNTHDRILRIAKARNMLRKRIINENIDYTIWIDQDVIVPDNLINKIIDILKTHRPLMLFVPISSRYDGRPFISTAFLVTNIWALKIADFTPVQDIDLGEDYSFIMRVRGIHPYLCVKNLPCKIIVIKNISLAHHPRENEYHSLKKLEKRVHIKGEYILTYCNLVFMNIEI